MYPNGIKSISRILAHAFSISPLSSLATTQWLPSQFLQQQLHAQKNSCVHDNNMLIKILF